MTGLELKNIIKSYNIKQKDIAHTIGVSEQALTSYFRTTDVRQETLDKIDTAILQLTNGQRGLFSTEPKLNEIPAEEQKKNNVEELAGLIKDVERELADIRIIRAELYQQQERIKKQDQEREQLFAERMKQIAELSKRLDLFVGVGNIPPGVLDAYVDKKVTPK